MFQMLLILLLKLASVTAAVETATATPDAAAGLSFVKKKKQILVISQWVIGEDLSRFAVELSKVKDLGYKIVFKLHPLNYRGWQEKYPWLVDSDVEVIDHSKI